MKQNANYKNARSCLQDVETQYCQVVDFDQQANHIFPSSKFNIHSLQWNLLSFYYCGAVEYVQNTSIGDDMRLDKNFFVEKAISSGSPCISEENQKISKYFRGSKNADHRRLEKLVSKQKTIKTIQLLDVQVVEWSELVVALGLPEKLNERKVDLRLKHFEIKEVFDFE